MSKYKADGNVILEGDVQMSRKDTAQRLNDQEDQIAQLQKRLEDADWVYALPTWVTTVVLFFGVSFMAILTGLVVRFLWNKMFDQLDNELTIGHLIIVGIVVGLICWGFRIGWQNVLATLAKPFRWIGEKVRNFFSTKTPEEV